MKSLKVILALLLALTMVFSACAQPVQNAPEKQPEEAAPAPAPAPAAPNALAFTPGTYSGTARGYNADITVDVTFSKDAITDIQIADSIETAHVGDSAFPILIPEIIAYTSTGIDVVSGASFTSRALFSAVEKAAEQAGASAADLRKGAKPYEKTPGAKITDTYDVVVVGAGGAGMMAAAEAAQAGATVIVLEKMAEMGGNTLIAGGSYQSAEPSLTWDIKNPEATGGTAPNGEKVAKNKMERGRLETLKMILDWKETPFDGTIADKSKTLTVDDYDLPARGVHAEFLPTLLALKDEIRAYMKYAQPKLDKGAAETELTLFSTVNLHIFQTYYGGVRVSADKSEWIYNDYTLVSQLATNAPDVKQWLADQGALFDYESAGTLIGCLWQRINRVGGGIVNGTEYKGNWGTYFKVPENTILKANTKNKIMTRTTAKSLVADASGRVTGVKAVMFDGTEVEITATKGVILATGGYGANIKMVTESNQYWDPKDLTMAIKTTNRNLSQGEGITMAQELGAAVVGMGWTQLMPLGWLDNGNLSGGTGENVIYISPAGTPNAGKRYVNEAAERDVLSQAAYDFGTDGGKYVELANPKNVSSMGTTLAPADKPRTSEDNIEGRIYFCTLAEAAALTEIDEQTLRDTITEYDNYVIGKSDKPSQPAKSAYRGTIGDCEQDDKGNYLPDTYKLEMVAVRFMAPSTHHTMGGLQVDGQRHVLKADGSIIAGLYAAGEVTGGVFAGNRLGGNAIVEIIVSGRIAAQNVLADAK